METGASWATVTTILKGCGTVQGTVAVYGQLKLWSYCYNHPQGMWDSSVAHQQFKGSTKEDVFTLGDFVAFEQKSL